MLDGSGEVDIIQSQSGKQCGCRPGFSGSLCDTCTGQVQWLEGIPECVSLYGFFLIVILFMSNGLKWWRW